jgi:hypothetical protein
MPFEGNGHEENNATDYSGYGNNGSVIGPDWNRTGGKIGGAYTFNGFEDDIRISHSSELNLNTSFTIEAWVYPRKWGNDGTIIRKDSSVNSNYALMINNGNSWSFYVYGLTTNHVERPVTGYGLNRWYHVVAVYNETDLLLYVNGTLIGNESTSGIPLTTTGELRIGQEYGGTDEFNGSIDEVRIYNISLSPSQIWANYQAGLMGNNPSIIVPSETSLNEQWLCSVTPNDGYSDGQTKNSTAVTITATNTAPTKVNLSTPTAGNTTVHRRYTRFTWDAAYDADSDPLNYTLNITSPYCSNLYYGNISSLNFTAQSELCIGNMYFWQVRAYDGTEYGQWSNRWNFTLEPIIILNLTTSRVNFGNLSNGDIVSTDSNASPLIVQNDGNIRMNISYVSAANSLFSSIGLNTAYFQFKIDNDTTETGSFNWTASQTSWTNITSIAVQNKSAIAHLKYQDSQDTAEIDIKVTIPTTEGAGRKSAIVYIIGESP